MNQPDEGSIRCNQDERTFQRPQLQHSSCRHGCRTLLDCSPQVQHIWGYRISSNNSDKEDITWIIFGWVCRLTRRSVWLVTSLAKPKSATLTCGGLERCNKMFWVGISENNQEWEAISSLLPAWGLGALYLDCECTVKVIALVSITYKFWTRYSQLKRHKFGMLGAELMFHLIVQSDNNRSMIECCT